MEKETNIIVRLTPKDKDAIKQIACAAGVTLSEYARKILLNGEIIVVDQEDRRTLNGLANNLNQLTRHFNSTGQRHPETEMLLMDLIKKIKNAYASRKL